MIKYKFYQDSVEELRRVFKKLNLIVDGIPCIKFADPEVKRICVSLWDTDKNGDINVSEAEENHLLESFYWSRTAIKAFDEMRLFTKLKQYNNQTFSNCTSLESIMLPDSFTKIAYRDFYNCTSLERIIIGKGVTSIEGESFNGCTSLKTIVWGGTETKIVDYNAFTNCAFEELEFPETMEFIGGSAFRYNNRLKRVLLGAKVKTLSWGSFRDCPLLTDVVVKAVTPPVCSNPYDTFANSPCTVYVPDTAVNAYKTASGWIGFASRIKPISEYKEEL